MSDTTDLVVVAGGAGAVGRMLGEALRRDGADVLVVKHGEKKKEPKM